MKISFYLERWLPLSFVISAVTGIGLHLVGHGTSYGVWHNWATAHVISSAFLLVPVAFHIKRHRHWYKTIVSRGIGRKSRITLALSVVLLIVVITGIVLIACGETDSIVGLWHYWLGLVLIVCSIIHIAMRKPRR